MAAPAGGRMIADRYELGSQLGRGGMGVVWRTHDLMLGRPVAVKEVVFPPTMPDDERRAAHARVLREARTAAGLHHRAAVTVYDVVQDRGGSFIVMELVEAPTLADLVEAKGPLAPVRVAELGVQLAGALQAAHRAGIVHRNVKPGNVMVPEDGGVKLADFGIASLQGDPRLTSTGLVFGSPAYMAPEQARGQPSGPPADLWALGATLFYAVEGEPPFGKGALIPTLAAVVNEDPRPMRWAGPLAAVIGALLTKDPAARPSAAKVRAWLGGLVVDRSVPPAQVLSTRGTGSTASLRPAGSPPTLESPPPPAAAGRSQRSKDAPAFQPTELPPEGTPAVQRASRPVLPPTPPMRRRDRGRLRDLLALLMVAALFAAWLISTIGTDRGDRQAAPTGTKSHAGPTATTQPAPSTIQQPTTTKAPHPPTSAAPRGRLPGGWRSFTNRAGSNRVGVPPGFQAQTRPSYHATVVQEQHAPERVFTVRSTTPANPLPQASRDYRVWARRNFAGFREVRYAEGQVYAGRPGAVVFEYEAVRDGRRVHVSHINVKGRTWGYNIEFIAPVDQWTSSQELARQFEQAFQPLG